jgi:hypothetical protein
MESGIWKWRSPSGWYRVKSPGSPTGVAVAAGSEAEGGGVAAGAAEPVAHPQRPGARTGRTTARAGAHRLDRIMRPSYAVARVLARGRKIREFGACPSPSPSS